MAVYTTKIRHARVYAWAIRWKRNGCSDKTILHNLAARGITITDRTLDRWFARAGVSPRRARRRLSPGEQEALDAIKTCFLAARDESIDAPTRRALRARAQRLATSVQSPTLRTSMLAWLQRPSPEIQQQLAQLWDETLAENARAELGRDCPYCGRRIAADSTLGKHVSRAHRTKKESSA